MLRFHEINAAGSPLVGGKLYTAQPGTVAGPGQSFPKATYVTSAGDVANTNPVILDVSGKAGLWLNGNYSMALYDANNVLIESILNVVGTANDVFQPNGIDVIAFYDTTLATVNVSIPAAHDLDVGPMVFVKTDDSVNMVTIAPVTGTILGQPSYSLQTQNESVRLIPQASTNDWKRGM